MGPYRVEHNEYGQGRVIDLGCIARRWTDSEFAESLCADLNAAYLAGQQSQAERCRLLEEALRAMYEEFGPAEGYWADSEQRRVLTQARTLLEGSNG